MRAPIHHRDRLLPQPSLTVAGRHAALQTPELANWLTGLFPDKQLVICCYIYQDGEAFVRASVAMDAIIKAVSARRAVKPAIAFIDTPTHVHCVPDTADAGDFKIGCVSRVSAALYAGAPLWQKALRWQLKPVRAGGGWWGVVVVLIPEEWWWCSSRRSGGGAHHGGVVVVLIPEEWWWCSSWRSGGGAHHGGVVVVLITWCCGPSHTKHMIAALSPRAPSHTPLPAGAIQLRPAHHRRDQPSAAVLRQFAAAPPSPI